MGAVDRTGSGRRRPAEQGLGSSESLRARPLELLVDAHAFLWFVSGDAKLSDRARQLIEEPRNTVFLSAVSVWEISIKRAQRQLPETARFSPSLSVYLKRHGFTELPVSPDHADMAGGLPPHHRDPFDRMLVAQALADGLSIVSIDPQLDAYGITRLW
jgi:PIN domain nuclease of toxin-antitoxin system